MTTVSDGGALPHVLPPEERTAEGIAPPELMKDTPDRVSLFTRIREAIARGDDAETSSLQLEMNRRMAELQDRYGAYARNLIDLPQADVEIGVANSYRLLPAGMTASPWGRAC